jgi:hypothetical protein
VSEAVTQDGDGLGLSRRRFVPLTAFQSRVLRLLAANRTDRSFFAGATPITIDGPRTSHDFDLFHDRPEMLDEAMARDEAVLRSAGLAVEWRRRGPTFNVGVVRDASETLTLEWVADSDFRFFPPMRDERFGFRLHPADIGTNKILAAAGRREPRDAVDLMELHRTLLPVGYLAWAAAAKDPGLTPPFILNELIRIARYTQEELDALATTSPVDAVQLRQELRAAVEEGRAVIEKLPPQDAGCLYLDANDNVAAPLPDALAGYRRHFGSRGGHWPTSSEILSDMARRGE